MVNGRRATSRSETCSSVQRNTKVMCKHIDNWASLCPFLRLELRIISYAVHTTLVGWGTDDQVALEEDACTLRKAAVSRFYNLSRWLRRSEVDPTLDTYLCVSGNPHRVVRDRLQNLTRAEAVTTRRQRKQGI